MSVITVRSGDWFTTINSDEPYYDTLLSPMRDFNVLPEELVFSDWTWLPRQWNLWMILKERLEEYNGVYPVQYEDPPIHYKDIELIHRTLLDLPEGWQSFVVLDGLDEIMKRNLLEASGRRSLDMGAWEIENKYRDRDIVLPASNPIGALLASIYVMDQYMYEHASQIVDEDKREQVIVRMNQYADLFFGMYQNAIISRLDSTWLAVDWKYAVKIIEEMKIYGEEVFTDWNYRLDSTIYRPHMQDPIQTMRLFADEFVPYIESREGPDDYRILSTMNVEMVDSELNPILYAMALKYSYIEGIRHGYDPYGLFGARTGVSGAEFWCEQVDSAIVRRAYSRITRLTDTDDIPQQYLIHTTLCLIGIIGRINASKLIPMLESIKKRDRAYADTIIVLNTIKEYKNDPIFSDNMKETLQDEDIDFYLNHFSYSISSSSSQSTSIQLLPPD